MKDITNTDTNTNVVKEKQNPLAVILPALILLLLLLPCLLLAAGLLLPPQYGESFLGEMKYKLQRLKETQGKRIILVGGSSVPFSVKSGLIADSFPDYEVIDYGLYADMGTVVMLDWAEEELHEGDIVILSPEQNEQALSCYFSGEDIWQAADGAWELIPRLSSGRYEKLAASFPVFAGKKAYYTFNGTPRPEGIYSRSSFNEYGDIDCAGREYNTMSLGYDPNHLISFSRDILSDDFLEEINRFAETAKQKGAEVYYRFCPVNALALEEGTTRRMIDSYYDYLSEELGFPILGNPHSTIMESGWFYDTNFHLNSSGAVVFTKGLIEDLKLLFSDTSLTAITVPAVPRRPQSAPGGDTSCTDCFTYLKEESGWIIDGLTEKGRSSSCLILPASFQGEPVVGIADTLFLGNTNLQQLTVQPNIGTLYDGMFHGCSGLKRLLLTSEKPSYVVGDALMEGADFVILVPDTAVDAYRRHYTWQKYDAFLTPMKPDDMLGSNVMF